MTARQSVEYVLPEQVFRAKPAVGQYYRSPSGATVLSVAKVRRVVGARTGASWRLIGMRIKARELPVGIEVLPWPRKLSKQPLATEATAQDPASHVGIAPPTPGVATPPAKSNPRKRIRELLKDDRDIDRAVPLVRIANGTVAVSEWRDPDDMSVYRRTPKLVRGFRAGDPIQAMEDNGTIGRTQAHAARKFRRLYEIGAIGLRASRDLSMPPTGFESGTPPSDSRLDALAAYQVASVALGKHLLAVILAIVIRGELIKAYAQRSGLNQSAASGYILAALNRLADHFKEAEEGEAPPTAA